MFEFLGGMLFGELISDDKVVYVKEPTPEKSKECDFCHHEADDRLGSGLLCGTHYFLSFPHKIKDYNFSNLSDKY